MEITSKKTDTTKVYLVRHGETEWNQIHRLQGHKDSPLTELGKKQAIDTIIPTLTIRFER